MTKKTSGPPRRRNAIIYNFPDGSRQQDTAPAVTAEKSKRSAKKSNSHGGKLIPSNSEKWVLREFHDVYHKEPCADLERLNDAMADWASGFSFINGADRGKRYFRQFALRGECFDRLQAEYAYNGEPDNLIRAMRSVTARHRRHYRKRSSSADT